MSNATDDIDLDDDDATADGPKALRDQVKKLNKRNAELETQLKEFAKVQRQASLAAALEANNADKRLAKFYTGDDVSESAVLDWLKEDGELLGWAPQDDESEADARQASRISSTAASAPPAAGKLSAEQELLRQYQTADFKTLIEQGLLPR